MACSLDLRVFSISQNAIGTFDSDETDEMKASARSSFRNHGEQIKARSKCQLPISWPLLWIRKAVCVSEWQITAFQVSIYS
jgi:hypothetical protein